MFQQWFQSRNLLPPSQKGGVFAFQGGNRLLVSLSIRIAWLLMVCFGMASQAHARCGASTKHMPWKYASNAELIRMDRSAFIPIAGPRDEQGGMSDSSGSHDQDLPCSTCRCRNEKEPGIPIETASTESTNHPIGRITEFLVPVRLPSMGSDLIPLSEMFLSPFLGVIERPPRS